MLIDFKLLTNCEALNIKTNEPLLLDEETAIKSFACMLKALRKATGKSLKAVSQEIDIPFQTIARYENGENIPSIIQALKFSTFYKIALNDMFLCGFFIMNCGLEFDKEDLENYYKSINK